MNECYHVGMLVWIQPGPGLTWLGRVDRVDPDGGVWVALVGTTGAIRVRVPRAWLAALHVVEESRTA